MNIESFNRNYKITINHFYESIQKIILSNKKGIFVKKEILEEENSEKYIIELISPKTKDTDDYGIVVDFFSYFDENIFNISIDVYKATGFIYLSKSFSLNDKNSNSENLFLEFEKFTQELSKLVLTLFEIDYK